MTFDRESRGVFAVILATAAVLIGANLIVNPAGLPGWASVAALILAGLAALLWALSWRESVTARGEQEPEAVVTLYTPPTPVIQPAEVHPPMRVPDSIPSPTPATVVMQAAPVFAPTPHEEQTIQRVVGHAPVVDEEPAPVVAAPAPEPEPVVEAVAPQPEPEPAVGDAPVISNASPVVEEAAEQAPTEPAAEIQAETVIHDEAAAPATAPEPTPPAVAEVISEAAPAPDDFTKLEGIGKYYNDALHKLGIQTYADLSKQTAEGLITQLKANGYRQHPAIPTWAEQAALAAAGDWDALAKLQETLDGGRRTEG